MKKYFREFMLIFIHLLPFGRTVTDIQLAVKRINLNEKDLDREIEQAIEALSASSDLVNTLESKLTERTEKLNKLKAEYENVKALTTLTEEQAKAVATKLENTLAGSRRKDIIINIIISSVVGGVIFIIGVFASDTVKNFGASLFG